MENQKKKLYYTIRQIGISKDQFDEYVKINALYENVPYEYQSIMEDWIMCVFRDNGYNITNENRGVDCSICIHNKQKAHCVDCGGTAICEHDNFKAICRICGGTAICEHDKQKYRCEDCCG